MIPPPKKKLNQEVYEILNQITKKPAFNLIAKKPPYKVSSMKAIESLPWNGFNVVSTFSGCGGSSLGYKMARFKVLWANEFIPEAQNTYRANHPLTILGTRDIRLIQASEILEAINMLPGELDLFDGSPPCSSFSTAGIREDGWGRVKKYSDSEQRTDDLFFEYARLIKDIQPKVFVAENVKGLTIGVAKNILGDFQEDMFQDQSGTIIHTLIDCGYKVGYRVLNAKELGVPQNRNRVIFVGVRNDIAKRHNLAPCWPSALLYQYSVRDALPNLDNTTYIVEGYGEKLNPNKKGNSFPRFKKKTIDMPCGTITAAASHINGAPSVFFENGMHRKITIEEAKRLCSFPDDFVLTGTYTKQWERLGRAVPPVMMKHVALTIRDQILKKITQ